MSGPGIDYGRGQANIDKENGIRYGVISQHSVMQAWADSAEPDYGEATCPECGNDAANDGELPEEEGYEQYGGEHGGGCPDYVCPSCKLTIDSSDAFGDEPVGWNYDDDSYKLTDCLDSDIMVLKSPFYTMAPFCSPCVPGAGNLDSANEDGVKSYCLGHDWFEDGKAPYPIYSVETGLLVEADVAEPASDPALDARAAGDGNEDGID